MPMQTKKTGDCRGLEADGSKSEKWCVLCYPNGAFIGNVESVEQMIEIVDKALIDDGSSALMRWMARKQIPRLERWR